MKHGIPAPTSFLLRVVLVFLLLPGCGDDEPASPGDKTPPAAVSDLGVIAGAPGSLTLVWTAPGDDASLGTAEAYDLRYSRSAITLAGWDAATSAEGEPTPRAAAKAETLRIDRLTPDAAYFIAIRSRDDSDNWSDLSNVVSAVASLNATAPAPITDLVATPSSMYSVTLTWTAPGSDGLQGTASEYDVRWDRRMITTENWPFALELDGEPLPRPAGEHETVEARSLPNGTLYYFAVKTRDAGGLWSKISNVASSAPLPDTLPPNPVVDLAGTAASPTSIALSWTSPGDDGSIGAATRYELRYSTVLLGEEDWDSARLVDSLMAPAPSGAPATFLVLGLQNDSTYYFALRSEDDAGNWSALSNLVAVNLATLQENAHWHTEIGQFQSEPSAPWLTSVAGYEGGVVVGGFVKRIDGVDMKGVTYWDGAGWLPTGIDLPWPDYDGFPSPEVRSLTVHEDGVVAAGLVYSMGPHGSYARTPILQRWNGSGWQQLGAPSGPQYAELDMAWGSGATLYYAGWYSTTNGPFDLEWDEVCYVERKFSSQTQRIAETSIRRYNPGKSSSQTGRVAQASDRTLAIVEHLGFVIAGGTFSAIDSVPASRVAMWDGVTWSPMGTGIDGAVLALASDGSRLIAGGKFVTAGGVTVNNVAEWDGATWRALGEGLGSSTSATVLDLEFHNGELYAAGDFTNLDACEIRNIARWDGAAWRGLGSGTSRLVEDMVSHDGVLYAVGRFDSAGGQPTNGVAIWGER